jgi:hypothetical protein
MACNYSRIWNTIYDRFIIEFWAVVTVPQRCSSRTQVADRGVFLIIVVAFIIRRVWPWTIVVKLPASTRLLLRTNISNNKYGHCSLYKMLYFVSGSPNSLHRLSYSFFFSKYFCFHIVELVLPLNMYEIFATEQFTTNNQSLLFKWEIQYPPITIDCNYVRLKIVWYLCSTAMPSTVELGQCSNKIYSIEPIGKRAISVCL